MNINDLFQLLKGETVIIEMTIKVSLQSAKPDSDVIAKCPYCDWQQSYSDETTAKRGLNGHLAHCSSYTEQTSWLAEMSKSNGHEYQDT